VDYGYSEFTVAAGSVIQVTLDRQANVLLLDPSASCRHTSFSTPRDSDEHLSPWWKQVARVAKCVQESETAG